MELNWSTFALEILNFLVLVWILKRFLYRPVLAVIAQRRADIDKTLGEARALHEEAETLQARYQARLGEWEQERREAREQLGRDIEAERSKRLEALEAELAQEKEKAAVAEARRYDDARLRAEETALLQAARFAARLLGELASEQLEERLVERVVRDMAALPEERMAALRNSWNGPDNEAVVTSAFPLPATQRDKLGEALRTLVGEAVPLRFEQDENLMAGIRIVLGSWLLGANLRDELGGLADFANGKRYD